MNCHVDFHKSDQTKSTWRMQSTLRMCFRQYYWKRQHEIVHLQTVKIQNKIACIVYFHLVHEAEEELCFIVYVC